MRVLSAEFRLVRVKAVVYANEAGAAPGIDAE